MMKVFKKTEPKTTDPKAAATAEARLLSPAELNDVAGGMRLNPQPLPPRY